MQWDQQPSEHYIYILYMYLSQWITFMLEYSCNKYCNLIGQIDATNQLRTLQVY